MRNHKDDYPAFWTSMDIDGDGLEKGMTLRDHFAGLALQGLISGALSGGFDLSDNSASVFSMRAYEFADAMLTEREK